MATVIFDGIAKVLFPRTCAIFEERILYGVRLSRTEKDVVKLLMDRDRLASACDELGVTAAQRNALLVKFGITG